MYHSKECGFQVQNGLTEKQVKTYNRLSKIICNVPSVSCYQGDCEMRPGTVNLIKNTEEQSEDDNVDNTAYRSTLETIVQSCNDFHKSFAEKLNILLCHSFMMTAIMFQQRIEVEI